jgi:hypothetical protein
LGSALLPLADGPSMDRLALPSCSGLVVGVVLNLNPTDSSYKEPGVWIMLPCMAESTRPKDTKRPGGGNGSNTPMACETRNRLMSAWMHSKDAHSHALTLMNGAGGFNLRVARVAIRRTYAERAYCETALKDHELEHGCAWASAASVGAGGPELSYSNVLSRATDNSD